MSELFTVGSVCSGIEAASVALVPIGFKPIWLSEIDAGPCAVLAHHYPNVPNLGDMTKIAALIRDCFVPAPDMLCGGTPCQAFSIAGLRNSLDDDRGNLSLIFCEIADEIDKRRAADGLLPAVILWENVPGVLSTSDNAFGCFLAGLAGEDDPIEPPGAKWANAGCVYGPKRTVAWRVFDAQYFGVAQRRRRVFVVASAREGFDPAEVLFEFDGMRRDTAPRREAGESITHPVAPCLTSSGPGVERGGDTRGQDPVVAVPFAPALSHCLNAGAMGRQDWETETMVVDAAPAALSVALRGRDGGATAELGDEVAGTQRASSGGGDKAHVLAPIAHVETMPTLRDGSQNGGAGHGARSGDSKDEYIVPVCITGDVTHTLKAEGFDASEDGTGRGQPIVAAYTTKLHNTKSNGAGKIYPEYTASLDANSPPPALLTAMAVRRLLPVECCRLQGFPDDYLSQVMVRGKPMADGPMYKALGNSWAVPNVTWIGRRIYSMLTKGHV